MAKTFAQTNESIEAYAVDTFHPEDAVLREIRVRAEKAGLPAIHVGPMDGLHLNVLAHAFNAKKIVEIGTLAGYSGVCLARALPAGGKLWTFEFEPKHAEIALESFSRSNVRDKVEVIVGSAIENLRKIESQGPFDLVFIDADKTGYVDYLEWTVRNLRVGGAFLADNTFAGGMIADADSATERVRALRQFNQLAAQHPQLKTTVLPTGEGLTFGVKIRS